MQNSFLNYTKQLFLIVFSVVLGILLSERIEERKNEKEAELLLSKIKSEVNDTKILLEEWVPYHRKIVQRLDSLVNQESFVKRFIANEDALFHEVLTEGTLMGRTPSSDAWDIAKAHPLIVHFDYDDLLILSKIYNQQKMMYSSVPKIMELFFSSDFNSEKNAQPNLKAFNNHMREVLSREVQWIVYFKEAEQILEFQNIEKEIKE